jgi:hypothetical protein
VKPSEISSHTPSSDPVKSPQDYLLAAANFATVALVTSASVVAVQSPLKTLTLRLSLGKDVQLMPIFSREAGFAAGLLGGLRTLWTGTTTSLCSRAVSTGYLTGAKSTQPNEVSEKDSSPKKTHAGVSLVGIALGGVIVTQIPSSLVDYKKIGILPPGFNWRTRHNMFELLKGNLGVKWLQSVGLFYSLCVLEDKYATILAPSLPPLMTPFASGALSGVSSTLLTYPVTLFIDSTSVKTTVNKEGKLINMGPRQHANYLINVFWENPRESLLDFSSNAAKQIPLRALSSAISFSIIAGVAKLLGEKPLQAIIPSKPTSPVGHNKNAFFNNNKSDVPSSSSQQTAEVDDDSFNHFMRLGIYLK